LKTKPWPLIVLYKGILYPPHIVEIIIKLIIQLYGVLISWCYSV